MQGAGEMLQYSAAIYRYMLLACHSTALQTCCATYGTRGFVPQSQQLAPHNCNLFVKTWWWTALTYIWRAFKPTSNLNPSFSSSGAPFYSAHGGEEKALTLTLQMRLVSFVFPLNFSSLVVSFLVVSSIKGHPFCTAHHSYHFPLWITSVHFSWNTNKSVHATVLQLMPRHYYLKLLLEVTIS